MSQAGTTTVQARCGCGYLHPVQVGRLADGASSTIESRSVSPNAGAAREGAMQRGGSTQFSVTPLAPYHLTTTTTTTKGPAVDAAAFTSEHRLSLLAVTDISERLDHREKELIHAYGLLNQFQGITEEQKAHIEGDAARHQQQLKGMREQLQEHEQLSTDRTSEIRLLREENDRMRGALQKAEDSEHTHLRLSDRYRAENRQLNEITARYTDLSRTHESCERTQYELREKTTVMSRQLNEAHLQLQLMNTEAGRENKQLKKELGVLSDRYQAAEKDVLSRARENSELSEECRVSRLKLGSQSFADLQAEVARLAHDNERLRGAAVHDEARLKELSEAFDLIEPVQEEFRNRLREYSEATEEVRDNLVSRDSEIVALKSQLHDPNRNASVARDRRERAHQVEVLGQEMQQLREQLTEVLQDFIGGSPPRSPRSPRSPQSGRGSPHRSPTSRSGCSFDADSSVRRHHSFHRLGSVRKGEAQPMSVTTEMIIAAASDCAAQNRRFREASIDKKQTLSQVRQSLKGLLDEAGGDVRDEAVSADVHQLSILCVDAVRTLHRQAQKMRHELQDITLDFNDVSAELEEARRQNGIAAGQHDSLQRALDARSPSAERQRLEHDNSDLAAQLESLREEHAEVCRQSHDAHQAVQEMSALKEELASKTADILAMQDDRASMQRMMQMLEDKARTQTDAPAENIEAALASVLHRFEQAERALNILQQQRQAGEQKLQDAISEVDVLQTQLAESQQEAHQGKAEVGQLRQQQQQHTQQLQQQAQQHKQELQQQIPTTPPVSPHAHRDALEELAQLRDQIDERDAELARLRNSSIQSTAVGMSGVPLDMTFQQTPVLLDKIQHEAGNHNPEINTLRERLTKAEQEYVDARRAQDMLKQHPSKLPPDHPTVVALRTAEQKIDDIASIIRLKTELDELRRLPPLSLEPLVDEEALARQAGLARDCETLRGENRQLLNENELLHEQLAEARARRSPRSPPRESADMQQVRERNNELQQENNALMHDVSELQRAVVDMQEALSLEESGLPPAELIEQSLADEQLKRKQLAAKNRRLENELEQLSKRPQRETNVRKDLKDLKGVVEELRKENWRLRKSLTEIEQEKDFKFMKRLERSQVKVCSSFNKVSRKIEMWKGIRTVWPTTFDFWTVWAQHVSIKTVQPQTFVKKTVQTQNVCKKDSSDPGSGREGLRVSGGRRVRGGTPH